MIVNFDSKETEKIFNGFFSTKLPRNIQRIAKRKLEMIEASSNLNDLRVPPANRLEKLLGSKPNYYSIRINLQWRICFTWQNNNAYDVKIVDYH